ncbi:hypothetical protein EUGRSUZ_E02135 [Eucalyptus grandis]|uniref:Uncharacterized protein n=2 Tax=Eucalyptus grandis TaxID=71139 RepID=A0ACC3KW46_EUCGR|nr:hypothetical protein EUGRSUZ_E02135 [Eucalyptus grandis]
MLIRLTSIIVLYKLLVCGPFLLQEAQTYAQEHGLFFMETSAKTAANVNEIFYEIGITVLSMHSSRECIVYIMHAILVFIYMYSSLP